jgi:hypothetical protein
MILITERTQVMLLKEIITDYSENRMNILKKVSSQLTEL